MKENIDMRKTLFFIALSGILVSISYLFWRESIRYTLPAKKPASIKVLPIGSKVQTGFSLTKPLFVHFHNMDCPCSRFNMSELEDLIHLYRDKVNFLVVLNTNGERNEVRDFEKKYNLEVPVLEDRDGEFSYSMGIYATPQAIIINDRDSTVYYSGNYNLGRYCVSQNTRFARMAIESLLSRKPAPLLPDVAYIPFGCEVDKYRN